MVAVIKDTSKKLFFLKFPNEDFDASVCFFNFFFYWTFLKKHTPLLEWKISLLEKSWKNKRTSGTNIFKQSKSLREKCLYSELFWSAFSHFRTEFGEILRPNSVRMWEIADQNNSKHEHFLRSKCWPISYHWSFSNPLENIRILEVFNFFREYRKKLLGWNRLYGSRLDLNILIVVGLQFY